MPSQQQQFCSLLGLISLIPASYFFFFIAFMSLIQNTLRSQTFTGLENVTNKKANTSRLPNTAKEKYMTPALM